MMNYIFCCYYPNLSVIVLSELFPLAFDPGNALEEDRSLLAAWSNKYMLKFNAAKCVVLKLSRKLNYKISLNCIFLDAVEEWRDLGIIIRKYISTSNYTVDIVRKSDRVHSSNVVLLGTSQKVTLSNISMLRSLPDYRNP